MRLLLLLGLAGLLSAQSADPWKPLQFLKGEWAGEGAGSPGESAGVCSFAFDLQQKVMIRKSYAKAPTFLHEDLMVIYLDAASKSLKAIYFDSEDHVIHYAVESGTDSVQFLNEQYRLIYRKAPGDRLSLDFDIASPGKPFAITSTPRSGKSSHHGSASITCISGSKNTVLSFVSFARSTSPQLRT
jgi:hypothetical protein